MMNFIKEYKLVVALIVIFIFTLSFFGIRHLLTLDDIYIESSLRNEEYQMIDKKYGINEYSRIIVSENQMALNYLNDYKSNLMNDINSAYNSLNIEYRNKKFGSIEVFKEYIKNINVYNIVLDKYRVEEINDLEYYYLYDTNDNLYIFKINSVMEYELYLDEETVEI